MATMIKKQDKPIGSVSFQIGTMMRTIDVYVYGWGVSVSVRDKTEKGQTIFDFRNFNETKKYPDTESNIRRGMRYYKASDMQIEKVQRAWVQNTHNISIEELTMYYTDIIRNRTEKSPGHFSVIVREYIDKKESYIRIHYNNYKDNSEGATYYLAQRDYTISSDYPESGSEDNLTIEQAARYMANFLYYTRRGFSLKEIWKMESA